MIEQGSRISLEREIVDPWTQVFDNAMDEILREKQATASGAMPKTRLDLFDIPTLLVSPEDLSDLGPQLHYQTLGGELGSRIKLRPERDDLTREAARYAAGTCKLLFERHISLDSTDEQRKRSQDIIQAGMAAFAVGIVINTKSATSLDVVTGYVTGEDGSRHPVVEEKEVYWKGKPTRDRVISEFNKHMEATNGTPPFIESG